MPLPPPGVRQPAARRGHHVALRGPAHILPRPVPDVGGGVPLRRPAVLLLQRPKTADGFAADQRKLGRWAELHPSRSSSSMLVQVVLSCVVCSPPSFQEP